VFCDFVTYVESCGVRVDGDFGSYDGLTHGQFLPYLNSESSRRPVIRLSHPPSELAPHAIIDGHIQGGYWIPASEAREQQAFFTLVHEFGHFLSWRADKAAWDRVHEALVRSTNLFGILFPELMSKDERQLTFDEEKRAWAFGREHVHPPQKERGLAW